MRHRIQRVCLRKLSVSCRTASRSALQVLAGLSTIAVEGRVGCERDRTQETERVRKIVKGRLHKGGQNCGLIIVKADVHMKLQKKKKNMKDGGCHGKEDNYYWDMEI